ncbi:hypothetical protein LWI29_008728 [Acer saccharum]|uniref:Reverse transcriptase zinc-binding domain-containing protein n=1 Tax=Acer saccharum TaxID=4024 RepID=A0AA39SS55_ACESA|nr:hypothetical protein LWI29_008728 [Acer saccharum]
MGNLSKKGMAVDDLCPICSRGRESTLHAIWNCSKLKQVRSNVPFMSNNKWCDNASALDFLLFHTNILSIAELEMLCVILWRCWWRRNQIIHQAGVRSDEIVIDWAENFLKEFRNAYERNTDVSTLGSKKVLQNSGWKRPTEGVFKINTDAAFHSIIKLIGFGIVIRNYDGEVMGCSTQSISANFTPQSLLALTPSLADSDNSTLACWTRSRKWRPPQISSTSLHLEVVLDEDNAEF